jgi:hypothetical protein
MVDAQMLDAQSPTPLVRLHLRAGWCGLLVFVLLGIALELLHAFKSDAYLGVDNETRRLMWTLAHAHGIGLSLLQLGFAATLALSFDAVTPRLYWASRLLNASTLLIPGGFLLAGVHTYEGDPGLLIVLVPLGALLLLAAIASVISALSAR